MPDPNSKPHHRSSPTGTLLLGRNAGQRTLLNLPAIPVAAACAAGILIGNYLSPSILSCFLVAVVFLAAAVLMRNQRFQQALILGFACCSMAAWSLYLQQPPPSTDVANWAPERFSPVVLRAEVASTVELRPNPLAEQRPQSQVSRFQSVFEFRIQEVRDGKQWQSVSGKVRGVVQEDATQFLFGDQVIIYGQLAHIGPPTNPGETDFRKLFGARGIGGRVVIDSVDQIQLVKSGPPGPMRMLSWISARGDRVLRSVIGDSQAELASAIVLGRRMAVPPKTRDLLVETGTVHLLSVSGLHLAMVAGIARVLVLLTGLNRGMQMIIILGVCIFFAGLTGAKPPVLRASFLVASLLIASWTARIPHTLNSLAVAAIILMLLHPNTVLEIGAQLSFIAVATLVVTGRSITDAAKQDIATENLILQSKSALHASLKKVAQYLVTSAKVSFWVWIITAPLVWHAYNVLAPVSIIANIVVVPLLAVTLTLGLLTTTIGFFSHTVAMPLGLSCKISIAAILKVSHWFSELPFAFIWLPAPPAIFILVFYAFLLIPSLASRTRIFPASLKFPQRFRLGWCLLWFLATVPVALQKFQPPSSDLRLTFIDVGHGTSVLIQLPDGAGNWLYDAGRLGDPIWSISPIEDVLWSEGIHSLDGVIVSHADSDHYNAIPDLLRRFNVPNVYLPPGLIDDPQIGLEPVRKAVSEHEPAIHIVHTGSTLEGRDGKTWGKILHPTKTRIEGSDNANSVVLLIEYAGGSCLLPGDLEMPGTDNLLEIPRPAPGGVMMSPHHGSLQQDVRPLLDWQRPSVVVVSGGNRAARDEVIERQSQTGAACYITSQLGAIRITVDKQGNIESTHWNINKWQACQ